MYFFGGCFQIKKLKGQLEERQKNIRLDTLHPEDSVLQNGTDVHATDLQSKCQSSCRRNPLAVCDFYCTSAGRENYHGKEWPVFPTFSQEPLSTEAESCFFVG